VLHKELRIRTVEVPREMNDPGVWKRALSLGFMYAALGLVLGLVCILSGVVLFFHGISGAVSWTASAFGLKSSLSDAPAGVVLFVVGLFVVVATRFRVVAKK
jgi:hypothetical protein